MRLVFWLHAHVAKLVYRMIYSVTVFRVKTKKHTAEKGSLMVGEKMIRIATSLIVLCAQNVFCAQKESMLNQGDVSAQKSDLLRSKDAGDLVSACIRDDAKSAAVLLKKNPDLLTAGYHIPLLIAAVNCGLHDFAAVLLQNKADTSVRDSYGMTALHNAAEKGREQMVTLLLDNKADPSSGNAGEWTPLEMLLKEEGKRASRTVVKLLVAAESPFPRSHDSFHGPECPRRYQRGPRVSPSDQFCTTCANMKMYFEVKSEVEQEKNKKHESVEDDKNPVA